MSLEEMDKSFECDKTIFSMMYHINLQREQDENIITRLNKTISSSKYRLKGLELLSANIRSLPMEVILNNASFWLNICVGQHHKSLKEVKLSILGKMIERAYEEQDFTKKLLSDYMTKILELCLSSQVNAYEIDAALLTLSVCMKRYGSWFGAHKSKIELFLLHFLWSESKNLVEKAAEAFLQLQQVGGAGIDGINHRSNFSSSFHKLCITTQKLLDKLFEHETEIEQYDFSTDNGYLLPESINDISKVAVYLENCLKFIKTMMLKRFPEIKEIKPIEILNVILRGTSLHLCLTGSDEKSLQDIHLSTVLNCIQIKLVELLDVFIIWFQGNSLPFSYTISKLLIDCLSRSQKCKCFKINSRYTETVYRVLNCWLSVSRCGFQISFQTKLIDCLLEDITPTKSEIKLIVNNDKNAVTKNKRVQIRNSIVNGLNSSTRLISDSELVQQEKNCCTALTTLKYMLRSSWLRVNTEKLQSLYTVIIGTAVDVITKKHIHPYTNLSCQEKLFDVLVTFYEESSLSVLPNINVALDILTKGRNSNNLKISSVCERGLSFLEILCQPICPSLYSSENSSWKHADVSEEIFKNITQIDVSNDDQNDIMVDSNVQSESTVILECVNEDQDIVESLTEIIAEDITPMKDVEEKQPVHILDIQILKPSENSECSDIIPKLDVFEIITENIQSEEVGEEPENPESSLGNVHAENVTVEIISQYTADTQITTTDNQTISHIKDEELDEPPAKIFKLEAKSEEIFGEFVDQVKEY